MTQSYWASLGLPFTRSPRALSWPLVFLFMGSCVLFVFFSWASLARLLPLGFLIPFTNLHSHEPLLTSLDFPGPITSFSSLGFMGLPLTLYFLCMHYFWACSGLLSLFPNHILSMGMLFLSFQAFLSPFTSSRLICLFHEPVIYHSCCLGLMALSFVCYPYYWAFCLPLGSLKSDPQQSIINYGWHSISI